MSRSKPDRRHPRHHFRAASHASAHAAEEHKPAAIPQHPLIPRNQASLLTTPPELAALIDHTRSVGSFAYDTEFIGELSYHPKLCLIQIATQERVELIDALADLDLAPFWDLLADASVEKIVHAGEQDIEPVFRIIGRPAANIFDTQVAAGMVGLAYPSGLSKLVRELVGVRLGKGFTFTHWDQRPLTAVQLRYAADDVRYLPALRASIGQKLNELGHEQWAKDECAALCDPARYAIDLASDFTRVRGAGSLSPQQQTTLRELYAWRDTAAKRHDEPPRSYVKDDILLDMARKPPRVVADLDRVKGLPRPVEEAEGENILAAVGRGLSAPESEQPLILAGEESSLDRFSADSLWAAIQAYSHGRGVDPALVSSRQEIARFLRHHRNEEPLPPLRVLQNWRREFLGKILLRFLAGESEFQLNWKNGAMQSVTTEKTVS
jgi:ribonuclease D